MMKSREFKKIYDPKLDRFVYEHRGNGLIIDNVMKPLKAGLFTAVFKATRGVVRKFGKKAKSATATAKEKAKAMIEEKSGDLIRRRLSRSGTPRGRQCTSRGRSRASNAKMSQNEVNTLINNLKARS